MVGRQVRHTRTGRSLRMLRLPLLSLLAVSSLATPAFAAPEKYKVDPFHSTSAFRIIHANIAPFWGRFNEPTGTFALDEADPTKSTFMIELAADKVDSA